MRAKVEAITVWVLILTPTLWVLWDVLAYIYGGNPSTESANLENFGYRYPSLPLTWGYLTAHFFAQKRLPSTTALPGGKSWFYRPVAWVALAFNIVIFLSDKIHYPSIFTQLVQSIPGPGHGAIEMVFLGIAVGYFVFQMDDETI